MINEETRSTGLDYSSPERVEHVKGMFAAYADGDLSITDLVDELESRGMKTRRTATRTPKPLTRSQVHRILSDSYYTGKLTYGGVEYVGQHEPLIDEGTWYRVQALLANRRLAGDRSWRNDHYLTGSLRCALCDSRLGLASRPADAAASTRTSSASAGPRSARRAICHTCVLRWSSSGSLSIGRRLR